MLSISNNKYVIIMLINVLLLIVGMFMETIAALIILFPPLLAVAVGVGIEPVHFATFAVLNLMIGLTTPPVGVCLFVCANIAKTPLSAVIRDIFPFLMGNIVVLVMVSYIPQLSLWLPNVLFGAK
jgi:TRAP-type C4-dicarboxylate transport system permease large subunit